ncbi:hypothetical protein BRARA_B01024 [Brassica rapa]|uniref:Uncharacterized protein n=1 Tax=Brassica campestris TaxID=3711 RepID=A0A398AE23_BRACM|nr:hypothetical protein BRARA_B01024 [Brassica rapa]
MTISVKRSNPKRATITYDFLRFITQITVNPGFKSRRERFIKQLCILQRKDLQEIFNIVQINLAKRGSS